MTVANEPGCRLLVYTTEGDRFGHHSLAEELVERARDDGLLGATVWRAIEGFGRSGVVRTARFPDVDMDMPLVVEVVDRTSRVADFATVAAELAPGALMTTEPVQIERNERADHRPPRS
jgi:PII-like signaling protein